MKGRFWRKALAASFALLIVSGSVPIKPISNVFESMIVTAHAATDETKTFTNSNITAGSTNQLNYDGNLFISATGDEMAFKSNYNPYYIALYGPYQQEGTLRLYPHISGKVKSIVFSSAYMTTGQGYMKIGKGSTWTNSFSENDEGNNAWKSFEFSNADGIQLENEDDYLEIKLYDATYNGSFFSKGSINITYEPTASTLTHTHNFSYSKNGSTLTATCAHNDGKDCSLASDNWQISTTLTPPTFPAYGQYVYHPATLSNIAGFTAETGATVGDITYVNNTTSESLGTSMPHDIGAYTASVTINAGGTDYTLTTSYSVGTFCGINTNYPQFTTDKEGNYALDGETVTLTFTPQFGETLTGVTATGTTSGNNIALTPKSDNSYTFTMPQEDVNIGATFSISENDFAQTGENEYTIKTNNGWNWFCFALNYGLISDGFNGKTVKLATDVESSEMAGTSNHPFKGTFDGQGKTLTFNLTASEGYSAPFHYTDDATISNLHVTGLIEGNSISPLAGLVGKATGNITIENCHVSTQISTTVSISAWHGGVIAFWDDSNVTCTITGCVYDGLIYNPSEANATSYCFGFIGNSYGSNMDITFTDCLFAPAEYTNDKKALREDYGCHTFVYPKSGLIFHVTNCYYTRTLGTAQGKQAHTITAGEGVTIGYGTETEYYSVSDIKAYSTGLAYNGNFYAGEGDEVALTLGNTAPDGYTFKGYTVNAGTLADSTLTMPDADVTVSAVFARVYEDGIGEHLAGHSLSLTGNIGVNFYMELDADVISNPDTYMHFTLPNGKTQDVNIGQATIKPISDKTYYVFQCEVAAKEMTDKITAQMFSGDKSGQVYEYTVKQYADYLFDNAYEADGTTVKNQSYVDAIPLIEAMVNYGAYSQTYFNHNTDALANAGRTNTDVSTVTADTVNKPYDSSTANLPSGVTFAGANLELESETVLNLYFTNTTGKALTFTTSGNVTLNQKQDGTYTKVTITGIAAQYLDNDVTVNVAVEDDNTEYSVKYSPMNYCYNTLSREITATRTEALKNVMRAFYLYNQEAKAYFATHNN